MSRKEESNPITLGIPVYDGVDLLDVAGPFEIFAWAAQSTGLKPLILSEGGNPVVSGNQVRFHAQAPFAEKPELDVLWVPGGLPDALKAMMKDPNSPYFVYLRQVAEKAKWVCSVCEGALLLARAGLLNGHRATTHWAFVRCLEKFMEVQVVEGHPRFVVSGNRLTGGGISSGLDESLELLRLLYGKKTAIAVQKTTQYFPRPPVHGRIPKKAPDCMIDWQTCS